MEARKQIKENETATKKTWVEPLIYILENENTEIGTVAGIEGSHPGVTGISSS